MRETVQAGLSWFSIRVRSTDEVRGRVRVRSMRRNTGMGPDTSTRVWLRRALSLLSLAQLGLRLRGLCLLL